MLSTLLSVLEIATHDYGYQNNRLVERTKNGATLSLRKPGPEPSTAQVYSMQHSDYITAAGLVTPVTAPPQPVPYIYHPLTPVSEHPLADVTVATDTTPKKHHQLPPPIDANSGYICRNGDTYATSFCRQLSLLIYRTFLNMWRDKSLTAMRLFIHCCIALLIGTMYVGIGNDASNVFNIFRYTFFSIMFTMFTAFSSMTLVCKYTMHLWMAVEICARSVKQFLKKTLDCSIEKISRLFVGF